MNYIIFDLEWNQCASEKEMVISPICLTGEIIEIGAVKLDDAFRKIDELRLYIRPVFYPKLHRQVSALTNIRDKDLAEKGLPFPEAFSKFQEWCSDRCSYMTWSMSDFPILLENMVIHGIDTTSLPDFYDLQRIFSREIMRFDRRLSLDDALKVLNEHGDVAHDALNDARNTAVVCNHLDLADYSEEYVTQPFMLSPDLNDYSSIQELVKDEQLRSCVCPACECQMHAEAWIHMPHEEFITRVVCPNEEDEFFLAMEVKYINSHRLRPFRMLYEMSDDLYEIYSDARDK